MIQKQRFQKEINAMNMEKSSVKLNKSSTIYNLDPFMDADGLIRAGRRLMHSHLNNSCKHSVLLPKQEKVTDLVWEIPHQTGTNNRGLKLMFSENHEIWHRDSYFEDKEKSQI